MKERLKRAKEIYSVKGLRGLLFRFLVFTYRKSRNYVYTYLGIVQSVFLYLNSIEKLHYSRSVLKLQQNEAPSLDEILATAFNYRGYGFYREISPLQHPKELVGLIREIDEINPESILEIGTDRGGTFYIWLQYFDLEKAISIDNDYSRISSSYLRHKDCRIKFYENFSERTDLDFVEANSQKEETRYIVEEKLSDNELDFVFIDGDHSYEGVKRDFNNYFDLVSSGGVIALHDIKDDRCGVPKFWQEVKKNHRTEEIYCSDKIGRDLPHLDQSTIENLEEKAGIGIVYKE